MKESTVMKRNAARLSVASNTFLTLFKLIVGLLSSSISIISEALHSLNDLVAALIANYAVKEASKPPDKEHCYGHGKIENVSALLEASLIVFAALFIIHEAIDRIFNPTPLQLMELGVFVMLLSTILNLSISLYLKKVAKATKSAALEADAAHLSADVYTSLSVFLGLLAIKFTGYLLLDPIIAILMAIYIIFIGIRLILKSSKELIDTKMGSAEEKRVMAIINSHKDKFVEFHEFRSRKAGSETYLDFHIVVAKDQTIEAAHALAEQIEKDIAKELPGTHAIVHIEPCNGKCEKCKQERICGKNHKL